MMLPSSPPLLGRLSWGVDGTALVAHSTESKITQSKENKQGIAKYFMHTLTSPIHVCLLVECHAWWNAKIILTRHKVYTRLH
jgi:hypothetical protein